MIYTTLLIIFIILLIISTGYNLTYDINCDIPVDYLLASNWGVIIGVLIIENNQEFFGYNGHFTRGWIFVSLLLGSVCVIYSAMSTYCNDFFIAIFEVQSVVFTLANILLFGEMISIGAFQLETRQT